MTKHGAEKLLSESRRKEIFSALVDAQDHEFGEGEVIRVKAGGRDLSQIIRGLDSTRIFPESNLTHSGSSPPQNPQPTFTDF